MDPAGVELWRRRSTTLMGMQHNIADISKTWIYEHQWRKISGIYNGQSDRQQPGDQAFQNVCPLIHRIAAIKYYQIQI